MRERKKDYFEELEEKRLYRLINIGRMEGEYSIN